MIYPIFLPPHIIAHGKPVSELAWCQYKAYSRVPHATRSNACCQEPVFDPIIHSLGMRTGEGAGSQGKPEIEGEGHWKCGMNYSVSNP